MADRYVDHTGDGTNGTAGWSTAYQTLGAAASASSAGDRILVASTHSNLQASNNTISFPTALPGVQVLCVTKSGASSWTGLATGAEEGCSTTGTFIIRGTAYVYGVAFRSSTASSSASSMTFNDSVGARYQLILEDCVFESRNNNANGALIVFGVGSTGSAWGHYARLIRPTFKFSGANGSIRLNGGRYLIEGMTIDSAGSAPTTLFSNNSGAGMCFFELRDSDLSGEVFTNLFLAPTSSQCYRLYNVRLPALTSWISGSISDLGQVSVDGHNIHQGDSRLGYVFSGYAGTVVEETTILRSGGGDVSFRMDPISGTRFPDIPLVIEGSIYNTTTGSPVTLTVEVLQKNASSAPTALDDDEIWLEVSFPGTSGYANYSVDYDSRAADVLATPSAQPTSSVTWTGYGADHVTKQYLDNTFTPQEEGYIQYRVVMTPGAAKTVYVDMLGATLS